ncbi:MAG: hypothetical protein CSA18_00485 [Deltaproteobacteria bacterium]|nr:MAG: hypothetical protein CSA18_00485 [Deltaproteobacteria bacterium]
MDFKTIMIWVFIGFFFLVMTNLAFIHCIKRDFNSKNEKVLWCSVSLIPFLGFIIYFIFGARKGQKK